MISCDLQLTLLSDATFGRGDGVAGLVDVEVQHDRYGMPYLGGRALKGLLAAECDDLVFAIKDRRWELAQTRLFGRPGATGKGIAIMHVGPARLPDDLRANIIYDVKNGLMSPEDVLESLTALRRQSAMNEHGAPREETLRTMRVVLRGTILVSRLTFRVAPGTDDLALLAATVKALRRAGTSRNRGRAKLDTLLVDGEETPASERYFREFKKAVLL